MLSNDSSELEKRVGRIEERNPTGGGHLDNGYILFKVDH